MKYPAFLIVAAFLCTALASAIARAEAQAISIVATTTDLADITRALCGDLAIVTSITTGQEDPHALSAKPGFVVSARDADLWIRIGMELEIGWEGPILRDSRNRRIQVGAPGHLDASTNVIRLDVPTQAITRAMGDVHPMGNPHYWLDPLNGRIVAKTITDKLSDLYPQHQDAFQQNLRDFQNDLDEHMFGQTLVARFGGAKLWRFLNDGTLKPQLAAADLGAGDGWYGLLEPYAGSYVVTYHRSWIYLLERFNLPVLAEMEPLPGVPPSGRHLAKLAQDMRDKQVRVILQEPFYNRKAADLLAKRSNATVLVRANACGGSAEATSYLAMLDSVIRGLHNALSNDTPQP